MRTYRLLTVLLLSLTLFACPSGPDSDGDSGGDSGGEVSASSSSESGTRIGSPEETRDREETVTRAAGAFTEVKIETTHGNIDVTGGDQENIVISGRLYARGYTSAEAEAQMNKIELVAEARPERPQRLHVRVVFPSDHPANTMGGHLTITLPAKLNILIGEETREAPVRIIRMDGSVDVNTTNGKVVVADVKGDVRVRTFQEPITCTRIGGNLDLKTKNAGIDVETFGGKVLLSTTNGPVEITHKAPPEPLDIDASTSGQQLFCKLPGTIKAKLVLRGPNGGRVKLHNFDKDRLDIKSPAQTPDYYSCTLNGGGEGSIKLSASNGTVWFEIRELTEPVK